LVTNQRSPGWLSDKIAGLAEGPAPRWWWRAFAVSLLATALGAALVLHLMTTGVGVWGVSHPVMWGWAIINFVWWIGIGHAGTLISAVLFLLRQRWRTAVNRAAEAMTIFAVLCAAIFPVIHLGRMWFAWWLFPVPTHNGVWPQFRSPLVWDVFAILTYFIVSLLFWYLGMIPDLAVLRDRARTGLRRFVYGLLALGWTGSHRHWHHYEKTYLIVAGFATPLVLSVHSIVSLDFAVSQLPGWHSAIFPPYFVAGAIFSGMGMVLTLLIPLRSLCRLEDIITPRHLDVMSKLLLATSCLVAYAYGTELATAWYSGNPDERFVAWNRATGPYAWAYWTMIVCNVFLPQLLWSKRVRANVVALFSVAVLVNVGMWFERFVIVVGPLHRDFMPANWTYYLPTWVDAGTFVGSLGLFATLFLLFLRFLPMIAIAEVKGVAPEPPVPVQPPEPAATQPLPDSPSLAAGANAGPPPTGLLVEFATSAELLKAARCLRAEGHSRWDAFTPYPLHHLSGPMGLRHSQVGWAAFLGGAFGFVFGLHLIQAMNATNYPLIVGGKPLFSPVAAFPVAFELAVLCGVLAVLAAWLWVTRLPHWHRPLLDHPRFALASHDRFFIYLDAADPRTHTAGVRQLLASAGARHMEFVTD
jgi:molybdopterin-containing oxidoreductase family membrane subunit